MDSGDEDDLQMANRDFERRKEALSKEGYREGKIAAREQLEEELHTATVNWQLPHLENLGKLLGYLQAGLRLGFGDEAQIQSFISRLQEHQKDVLGTTANVNGEDGSVSSDIPAHIYDNFRQIVDDIKNHLPDKEDAINQLLQNDFAANF